MRFLLVTVLALLCLSACVSETSRLEEQLRTHPDDAETLYQLGLAYRTEGRLLESARTLDRAAGLAPEHPYALNEAGVSYALARRYDLAVDRLERQIRLNDDPLAHSSLGSIYSDLYCYDKAEGELRAAIAGGLTYDGNILLAILRWRQFRSRDARAALEAARPNRIQSTMVGGKLPEIFGEENIAVLRQVIQLDEEAERVAGKSFTPPLVVPACDLATHAALEKVAGGERICRIDTDGETWRVYGVIIATSTGRLEIPRQGSNEDIVESIHQFRFRPGASAADKEKFFIRKFLPGQGRPPCWCAWNPCGSDDPWDL